MICRVLLSSVTVVVVVSDDVVEVFCVVLL